MQLYHRTDFVGEIYDLLYHLGVTANYTGFFQIAFAVQLCMEQPERLLLVTKWVYPDVARHYKTNWKAVERNIRTVNGIVWEQNRLYLEELAGRELLHKPSNAQLLAILVYSLLSQRASSLAVHGLGEAVTLPGEDHDMGVVDQTVNEGGGEAVVAKDGIPLAKLQIRGNDEAFPLVAVGDHLEKQLGGVLMEWDKANLVNDQ